MALTVPDAPRRDIAGFLEYIETSLKFAQKLDSDWIEPVEFRFSAAISQLDRLRRGFGEPFRIAVVGEFNAGKSTLINVLTGLPGLLKQGVAPTTGTVTELRGSKQELGEVFGADNQLIFTGTVEEVAAYADQRTPQGRSINGKGARVVLHIPADMLRNLIIIDTPGLGANDIDDETTRRALIEADAAILVVNGLRPGGDNSELLSERLRRTRRRFITVVTRLDLTKHPEDSLAAVSDLFGGISHGEPVGVRLLDAATALADLELATATSDEAGKARASATLEAAGYPELQARVNESLIVGSGAGGRALRTLTDIVDLLGPLQGQAIAEADLSQAQAGQLIQAEDEANRVISDVLRPRMRFLESKVEEVIDLHVGEFIADVGDAVNVYIDRLFDGGLSAGFEALGSRRSARARKQFEDKLLAGFQELFPPAELDITVDRINRAVRRLVELEWRQLAVESATPNTKSYDPSRLAAQVGEHIGKLSAALTAEMAALILLLFIPGGILIDIALFVLSLGAATKAGKKGSARMARIKAESRITLRTERKTLTHKLFEHYNKVNEETGQLLIDKLLSTADATSAERGRFLQRENEWRQAAGQLARLTESSREIIRTIESGGVAA